MTAAGEAGRPVAREAEQDAVMRAVWKEAGFVIRPTTAAAVIAALDAARPAPAAEGPEVERLTRELESHTSALRESQAALTVAREGQEASDRALAEAQREVGIEIGAAEVQRARFQRLLIAFHDATRRPLGVTPASGDEFYDWRQAETAEERRPRYGTDDEKAERPEARLVAAQREKAAALGLLDGQASVVQQLEREKASAETALAAARDVLSTVDDTLLGCSLAIGILSRATGDTDSTTQATIASARQRIADVIADPASHDRSAKCANP